MKHGEAIELINAYINAMNVPWPIGDLKGNLFRFLAWLDENGYEISKPAEARVKELESPQALSSTEHRTK